MDSASALDRASIREQDSGLTDFPVASYVDPEQHARLPIYQHRNELLYLVEKHGVVIVVGHTGCGKTTRR